jgi:hypothetical protein
VEAALMDKAKGGELFAKPGYRDSCRTFDSRVCE